MFGALEKEEEEEVKSVTNIFLLDEVGSSFTSCTSRTWNLQRFSWLAMTPKYIVIKICFINLIEMKCTVL